MIHTPSPPVCSLVPTLKPPDLRKSYNFTLFCHSISLCASSPHPTRAPFSRSPEVAIVLHPAGQSAAPSCPSCPQDFCCGAAITFPLTPSRHALRSCFHGSERRSPSPSMVGESSRGRAGFQRLPHPLAHPEATAALVRERVLLLSST